MHVSVRFLRRYAGVGLMVFAAALTGCAKPHAVLPPEAQKPVPEDYTYVIGPGDSVFFYVWGNPEVSRDATVRPDGKITAPLVEELPAAGKTPQQLARDVEQALGTYLKNPLVTVIVGGFQGMYDQQVRVVGEATNPQALPYRRGMTLLDLMIAVGGLTDFADGNGTTIIRKVDGQPHQFGVRIDDLIRDGDIAANVDIHPGDILIIPEAWF